MENILEIEILDNDKGGHDDLIFTIRGLVDKLKFDTYYFLIQISPCENFQDIRNAVVKLLSYWLMQLKNIKDEKPIYLPIDFSDQYTGCLRVVKKDENVQLTYGCSMVEGFSINPLNPGNYYDMITDFEDTENKTVTVSYPAFLTSVKTQIEYLENGS